MAPQPAPPQPTAASEATHGQTQAETGSISAQGQRNRYSFDGRQGQQLELRAKRTSGVTITPGLILIDPSGKEEASAGTGFCEPESFVERRLASTGTYTIVVVGACGTTGPYSVAWNLDRIGLLVPGSDVSGQIADRGQRDRYKLDAQQGQILELRVNRMSGVTLTPGLILIDPTGAEEAGAGTGFCNPESFLKRKLASSGTYTVIVVGACNTNGEYALHAAFK